MKALEYYMKLPYRLEIMPDTEESGFIAMFPACANLARLTFNCYL